MATIDTITFSITRTSFPTGHICSIDYSYFLRVDEAEFHQHDVFKIIIQLYGDDWLFDKPLGNEAYDTHVINANEPMPVKRHFAVDCEVLNEAIGADKVFINIQAVSRSGQVVSGRSETVRDWF